ncbi:MAG: AI-2E family transporter [Gemmataceae bacterium]
MNLNLGVATRYGLGFNGLLGIAVALYLSSSILIPITISVLFATILFPAAKWLHTRLRLPWFFACLLTISLLLVLSIAVCSALAVAVTSLVYQLPQDGTAWEQQYDRTVSRLRSDMPFLSQSVLPLTTENRNGFLTIQKALSVESITPYLIKLAGYGLEQTSQLILIMFVVLFLLLEAELLAQKIRGIFGTTHENQQRVATALAEMAEAIRTYLVWRTIVNLGLAIVLGLFYRYVVKLEHWYLWAVLTAVLSYVPYVGTIVAGAPPILDALIFNEHPAQGAVAIIVFYTLLVTIEGYLVVPWVMGKTMDLNATTVMISCLFWSLLWGLAGLFLAMPLMAAIKAIMLHVDGLRPWGELLSSVESTPTILPDETPMTRATGTATMEEATVVIEPK